MASMDFPTYIATADQMCAGMSEAQRVTIRVHDLLLLVAHLDEQVRRAVIGDLDAWRPTGIDTTSASPDDGSDIRPLH